jgi:MIP family channel proteins
VRDAARAHDVRRYVAEAIGTGVLVLIGPGASMVAAATGAFGHAGVSLAFGIVVFVLIVALGGVSGAHINPAVTLAFWSARRFPARDVAPYIAVQCIGAVVAAFGLRWLLGDVVSAGATVPAVTLGRAFAVEFGYSAILALVIFAVATDERVPPGLPAMAIGATVMVGALVTGPLTGGSFNPARSLGPAAASGVWTAHWLYWLAPVAGMLTGARMYAWLEPERARAVRLS